jgi:hypothetical protein
MYHHFDIQQFHVLPHSVFICFVWIWEQTALISTYGVKWLVFITETECVYCAARTESSNTAQLSTMLHSKHKTQHKCSTSPLPTVHFPSHYHLHFLTQYLVSSPPLLEGRAGITWENSEQQISVFLCHNNNSEKVWRLTLPPPPTLFSVICTISTATGFSTVLPFPLTLSFYQRSILIFISVMSYQRDTCR